MLTSSCLGASLPSAELVVMKSFGGTTAPEGLHCKMGCLGKNMQWADRNAEGGSRRGDTAPTKLG